MIFKNDQMGFNVQYLTYLYISEDLWVSDRWNIEFGLPIRDGLYLEEDNRDVAFQKFNELATLYKKSIEEYQFTPFEFETSNFKLIITDMVIAYYVMENKVDVYLSDKESQPISVFFDDQPDQKEVFVKKLEKHMEAM